MFFFSKTNIDNKILLNNTINIHMNIFSKTIFHINKNNQINKSMFNFIFNMNFLLRNEI